MNFFNKKVLLGLIILSSPFFVNAQSGLIFNLINKYSQNLPVIVNDERYKSLYTKEEKKRIEEDSKKIQGYDARESGMVHDRNFIISGPKEILEKALLEAEDIREKIAIDWFGEKMPDKEPIRGFDNRCAIHIELDGKKDIGITIPLENPTRSQIYITCSKEGLSDSLRHEITHDMLNSRYPNKELPAWAEESVASLEDDHSRFCHTERQKVLEWYVKNKQWPSSIRPLFELEHIRKANAYAVSTSLTEYLLTLEDKKTFLEFAVYAKKNSYDVALKRFYNILSVEDFQKNWQEWLIKKLKPKSK